MRPLILKITSNSPQPHHKATGSINVEIIRQSSSTSPKRLSFSESNEGSTSLVRNLVNKYEYSDTENLVKYRSKSMVDLSQYNRENPEIKITQDDSVYRKNDYIDEEIFDEWKANFKQAMNKFKHLPEDSIVAHKDRHNPGTIEEKAQRLLEATKHDYFWFNEVLELLQQIVREGQQVPLENCAKGTKDNSVSSMGSVDNEDDEVFEDESSVHNENCENTDLIKENLFVETSSDTRDDDCLQKTVCVQAADKKFRVPLKYFGKEDEVVDCNGVSTFDDHTVENNDLEQNNNATIAKDDQESDTHELNSSYYDDSEKSCQETEDIFENMLQPATNLEALKTVNDIMRKIEECDRKIDNISTENTTEVHRLNDLLVQVLRKLDDLETHEDGVVLSLKRKAFSFTQDCVKKLKSKVYGNNE